MKYFLTGGTGFIGGVLAQQLVEAGHDVVALVRTPAKADALRALGVTIAPGDITQPETLRAPMDGADGVFHVAAWYDVGVPNASAMAYQVNVEGTRNVLEAMRDLGIPKGVYTSTVAVFSDTHGAMRDEDYRYDGPHLSVYDETKWRAHYEVARPMIEDGLPLVIVQPGAVYGPGDTSLLAQTLKDYLQEKLPAIPLETTYCWAHVEDIAQAHIQAMAQGTPGESYIIAGPQHTMVEVFEEAHRITGIKLPSFRLGPGLLRGMSKMMGVVEKVVPVPQNFRAETLRVTAGTTYLGDNTKARRDLGYAPRSLAEGLPETLKHLLAELNMLA